MLRFGLAWLVAAALAMVLVPGVLPGGVPRAFAQAQTAPQVEVSPSCAAPGAAVTIRGSGWPSGVRLRARMYRDSDLNGPGADLRMTFETDETGAFTTDGIVPPTLFGAGSPGDLQVTPGAYTIVVRAGPGLFASTPFLVCSDSPCEGGD